MITVGDVLCCYFGPDATYNNPDVYTGNTITGYTRYVWGGYPGNTYDTFGPYTNPLILAVTANTTVHTGTGIPTLNVYGLVAMAFLFLGAGLLVFRRPQRIAT